jgi:uncharacterized membrane protein
MMEVVRFFYDGTSLAILFLLVGAVEPAFATAPCSACGFHSVPGPLMGAGLPVLAVGYGAYWLLRRYRRRPG